MLFNEEACFSTRVPKETIQAWLTHGGTVYPGGTSAVASYFFAVSREDEWTSILCRRSVVVIHVGWILHCVAHSFRVPVVGYILDDDFDAGLPFSRMGIQDHALASVVSPRYPQRVSRPFVPRSQPQIPLPNVLQKRKRQRDSLAYPNARHSESGDSLPRRPRKRYMLSLELSSSSAESLSDNAITEVRNSPATKRNHSARSTHAVTPNLIIMRHSLPVAFSPPSNLCQNTNPKDHRSIREVTSSINRLLTPTAPMNVPLDLLLPQTLPVLLRVLRTLLLCRRSTSPDCNFRPGTVCAFLFYV
ncbi:hypothetical protein BD769DRAFT_282618 [Suillus cothurnatus]|nr:hypothetical protein BD769DRAFT_282618 [Suillus cothurnatus]